MPTKCQFDNAWRGACDEPTADGAKYCPAHSGLQCMGCAPAVLTQATHTCAHTMGLVCGADLCDDCGHDLDRPMAFAHRRAKGAA